MVRSGRWYARSWWMGATMCAAVALFVLVASMATARVLSPTPPDPDFVPGEILIKLKSAVPLPHPSGGGAASSAAPSSRASLDALFARHAVSGAARVFPGAKTPRAGRRLRLQGQTIDAPDLTRVYKLTLGPGASVQAVPRSSPPIPASNTQNPTTGARNV